MTHLLSAVLETLFFDDFGSRLWLSCGPACLPFHVHPLQWLMRRSGDDMQDAPAFLLVKYNVPPTLHDDFIMKWYDSTRIEP